MSARIESNRPKGAVVAFGFASAKLPAEGAGPAGANPTMTVPEPRMAPLSRNDPMKAMQGAGQALEAREINDLPRVEAVPLPSPDGTIGRGVGKSCRAAAP